MSYIDLLALSTIDHIYKFLESDLKARKAFGMTCKRIHNLSCENEKYIALANFVEKAYTIEATNLENPLWIKLKNCKVYLVGETHSILWHRKIFADFTGKIWQEGKFTLLTEDKYEIGEGQVRFLNNEISKTAESWDIDCEAHKYIDRSQRTEALITRAFILMRDLQDPSLFVKNINDLINEIPYLIDDFNQIDAQHEELTRKAYSSFLSMIDYLNKTQVGKFDLNEEEGVIISKYDQNKALTFKDDYTFKYCKLKLLHALGKLISLKFEIEEVKRVNYAMKFNCFREQNMIKTILSKTSLNQKVIVYAGSFHVRDDQSSPVSYLRNKEIPFISLVPNSSSFKYKEFSNNDKESQKQSEFQIFSKIKPRNQLIDYMNNYLVRKYDYIMDEQLLGFDYFALIQLLGCTIRRVLFDEVNDVLHELEECVSSIEPLQRTEEGSNF